MTKFRKTSKRASLGFSVLDFPNLRLIRPERLFRILRHRSGQVSIFGFRIFPLARFASLRQIIRLGYVFAQVQQLENSKHEIRNSKQIQMTKFKKTSKRASLGFS